MKIEDLKNSNGNSTTIIPYVDLNCNHINNTHNLIVKTAYDIYKEVKIIQDRKFQDSNQIEIIEKLKTMDYKGIIACCPGPFTCLCQIQGFSTVLMDMVENKIYIKEELGKITETLIEFSKFLLSGGADLIYFDENYANLLSKEDYWNYSGEFCKKIFDCIDKKSILYISKNMDNLLEKILLTEVKSLCTDYNIKNMFLLDNIEEDIVLIQNINDDFLKDEEKNIIKKLNNIIYPYSIYNNVAFSIENKNCHKNFLNKLKLILNIIFSFKYNDLGVNRILHKIKIGVIEGQEDLVQINMYKALELNVDSFHILNGSLIAGINYIGELFKEGAIFIPELLMSSSAMYKGLDIIKPYIITNGSKAKGTVVIGTVEGDLHDIGKNLVAMMLESNFYEVINLGTNVKAQAFIEESKKHKANVIGLSALTTSTMEAMREIVKEIRKHPQLNNMKIIVGGAPVSENYAKEIGADGYSEDAAQAVSLVNSLIV